jgi:hypothetical protein
MPDVLASCTKLADDCQGVLVPEEHVVIDYTGVGKTRPAKVLLVICLVLAVAGVSVLTIRAWYSSHPHGSPDPGGKRLAFLAETARQAVPGDATVIRIELSQSKWDSETCDGDPPGWTEPSVTAAFHHLGEGVTDIDAAMQRQRWRTVRVQGGTAVREYKPADGNTKGTAYDAYAWLYSRTRSGATTWELDLTAEAAEVISHDC